MVRRESSSTRIALAALALAAATACASAIDTAAQQTGGSGRDGGSTADSGAGDAGSTDDAGSASNDDAGSDGGSAGSDDGGVDGGVATGDPDAGPVFTPLAVTAAVAKVKLLLVGTPPTNEEVAAVAADQSSLKGLVDQWQQLPQAEAKMRSFFATAFQQTQVVQEDFADQGADADDPRVLQGLRESFARTAIQLIKEGRPFTETMTTRRFMLTPRLMSLYAFVDSQHIDDAGRTTDQFAQKNPAFTYTMQFSQSQAPIPLEQSVDPTSANFMIFYNPKLNVSYDPLCPQDPIVYKTGAGFPPFGSALYFGALRGQAQPFGVIPPGSTVSHTCNPPPSASLFAAADFNTWQMVNIRPPVGTETPTKFYDLPALRTATELVLNIPRVSFFSTPAFFAGWQTNTSNVARVTLNQTMIVALGKAIDPTNTTAPPSLAALDQDHAAPGTACYSCHQSLDPMRQFFRQAYSLHFHQQNVPAQMNLPGMVAFHGVSDTGTSIFDLGAALAGHPSFASAWTQKLCTYATSAVCDETDPEFVRIAAAFKGSSHSWKTLVRELFSSPIVTYLKPTATGLAGQTFPLSRRDHLCTALSGRLGLTDVCGLDVNTAVPASLAVVKTIAAVLPSDQYSRGEEGAILANDPSLVFRTGMENVCAALSATLIDAGATPRWRSTTPAPAIADFVHLLMGITGDRDQGRIDLLTSHFNGARAAGETASDALKSTFVLACLSPSVVGVGQ